MSETAGQDSLPRSGEEWRSLPRPAISQQVTSAAATVQLMEEETRDSKAVCAKGEEASAVGDHLTQPSSSLAGQGGLTGGIPNSKQNCPTAKVAPIVEVSSRRTRSTDNKLLLELSPKLSRRTGFAGSSSGFDKTTWDSEEEKRRLKQMAAGRLLRETLSPMRRSEDVTEKLRSLISCLEDKSNIIERCVGHMMTT